MTTTTTPSLDGLTRDLTAFESFRDLLDTHHSYRPTIRPQADDRRYEVLADAYDRAQEARGDDRRAHRGGGQAHLFRSHRAHELSSYCPHAKVSNTCCGNPEWLRVIHAVNAAQPGSFGAPLNSYDWWAGGWAEEYPEFRVILRGNSTGARIQAMTAAACDLLQAAVKEVRGV